VLPFSPHRRPGIILILLGYPLRKEAGLPESLILNINGRSRILTADKKQSEATPLKRNIRSP
jgi:hypothetical protein